MNNVSEATATAMGSCKWMHASELMEQAACRYLRVLYIGTSPQTTDDLSRNFRHGYQASSYSEARSLLQYFLHCSSLYRTLDLILIDLPFDSQEIKKFSSFIQSDKAMRHLPLVYNKAALSGSEMQQLEQSDLVDDIIDATSDRIDYSSKVIFLKMIKHKLNEGQLLAAQRNPAASLWNQWALACKRLFDIVVAGSAILLLTPLLLLIALIIKVESKGPVLYISKRAGKNFRIFNFYKFRTMVADADQKVTALAHLNQYKEEGKGPKFFKVANDPRITRFGRLLRNSSLDELPQLFNVLLGDMSIVGNRPLPLYEAATLTTNEFVERFNAPAGITGLWQVQKRGKAEMSTSERMHLDISYARQYSPLFDLKILASTPLALFQKTDA